MVLRITAAREAKILPESSHKCNSLFYYYTLNSIYILLFLLYISMTD